MNSIAAKQFLISRALEQAKLENVSLSETEKKMLHFTEVHPSLPDIYEVNEEFGRNYDSNEYEAKIAGLLRKARLRDEQQSSVQAQQWKDALGALKNEDHYILVMVDQAFRSNSHIQANRLRDFLLYVAIGIGFVLILLVASILRSRH
jgi:hypothetical protein